MIPTQTKPESSLAPVPTERAGKANRYCCADNLFVDVGGNQLIVRNRSTGSSAIIPGALGRALQTCREFETLASHANRCQGELGLRTETKVIEETFEQMAAGGFLLAEREIAAPPRSHVSGEGPQRVRTIAIPSKDRPELADRAVESYARLVRKRGEEVEIVVHDASESEETGARYERLMRNAARESPAAFRLADANRRREFGQALKLESAVDEDLIDFALGVDAQGRPAFGGNCNSVLLDTIGESFYACDDDTIGRIAASPNKQEGIRLHTGGDPSELWFYDDAQSALESAELVDCDFLALHERVLGRRPADLADHQSTPEVGEGVQGGLLTHWRSGGARVRLTQMGIVGHSGMAMPSWFGLTGPSLQRWIGSEDSYRRALTSRCVFRAARRYTVSSGRFFMAGAAGYDHRLPLPPFSPLFRNSDGLFAACLRNVEETSCVAYLPYATAHLSPSERPFPAGHIFRQIQRCRTSDVLVAVVAAFQHEAAPADFWTRLRSLGRHLDGLSLMRPEAFREEVLLRVWALQGGWLRSLERKFADRSAIPNYFRADLERYLNSVRAAAVRADFLGSSECAQGSNGDGEASLRDYFGRFGRLLQCWPEIVGAAGKLREAGVRPSAPIAP